MSKPRGVLMEMPPHVMDQIIENLDLKTRFCFRVCSKEAKSIIDNSKISIKLLKINRFSNSIQILIQCTNSSIPVTIFEQYCSTYNRNYFERVLLHLNCICSLKIQKIELFEWNSTGILRQIEEKKILEVIRKNLKENKLFPVEELNIEVTCLIAHSFLPILNPNTLRKLKIGQFLIQFIKWDEISEMEQWKCLNSFVSNGHVDFEIVQKYMKHIQKLIIPLSYLNTQTVREIVEIFTESTGKKEWKVIGVEHQVIDSFYQFTRRQSEDPFVIELDGKKISMEHKLQERRGQEMRYQPQIKFIMN